MSWERSISSKVYPFLHKAGEQKRLGIKQRNLEISSNNVTHLKKSTIKFNALYSGTRVGKDYKYACNRLASRKLSLPHMRKSNLNEELCSFLINECERMLVHGKIHGKIRVLSKPERIHGYSGFRSPRGKLSPRLLNFLDAKLIKSHRKDMITQNLSIEVVDKLSEMKEVKEYEMMRIVREKRLDQSLVVNSAHDLSSIKDSCCSSLTTVKSIENLNYMSFTSKSLAENRLKIDGLRYIKAQTRFKILVMMIGVPRLKPLQMPLALKSKHLQFSECTKYASELSKIKELFQNSNLKSIEFLDDVGQSQSFCVSNDHFRFVFDLMASKIGAMFEYIIIKTNQQSLPQVTEMLDQISI